jgi:hypothetical protein
MTANTTTRSENKAQVLYGPKDLRLVSLPRSVETLGAPASLLLTRAHHLTGDPRDL